VEYLCCYATFAATTGHG